jgi:hypothetical protein
MHVIALQVGDKQQGRVVFLFWKRLRPLRFLFEAGFLLRVRAKRKSYEIPEC